MKFSLIFYLCGLLVLSAKLVFSDIPFFEVTNTVTSKWLNDLNDDSFQVRSQAKEKLLSMGPEVSAMPAFLQAKISSSSHVRRTLSAIENEYYYLKLKTQTKFIKSLIQKIKNCDAAKKPIEVFKKISLSSHDKYIHTVLSELLKDRIKITDLLKERKFEESTRLAKKYLEDYLDMLKNLKELMRNLEFEVLSISDDTVEVKSRDKESPVFKIPFGSNLIVRDKDNHIFEIITSIYVNFKIRYLFLNLQKKSYESKRYLSYIYNEPLPMGLKLGVDTLKYLVWVNEALENKHSIELILDDHQKADEAIRIQGLPSKGIVTAALTNTFFHKDEPIHHFIRDLVSLSPDEDPEFIISP